jgi:nicotinate-nucleotide adenylyltransferase
MSFQAQSNDSSPEVIVYGGTFDPPHNGHAQMVEAALNQFGAAEVLVIPAFAPSVGGQGLKSVVASFPQRVDMATLAFASSRRVKISTVEQELSTPSYTLNTLRLVSSQAAEKRLALLMGQDQFESFPRWHEPKAILNIADLIIIPRSSDEG